MGDAGRNYGVTGMSEFENQVESDRRLLGIPIKNNPTAILNTLQFDSVNNQFIWIAAPVVFDGLHTSLGDKEAAGVIDHADSSVTEAKINALAVSLAKMKTEVGNADLFIGYDALGVVVAKASGGGLGDLEFLSIKEKAGDLLHAEASGGAGALVSIIPASGKTFFVADWMLSNSIATNADTCELQLNAVIIETKHNAPMVTSAAKGMSLVGDGALIARLFGVGGNVKQVFLEGWIETT